MREFDGTAALWGRLLSTQQAAHHNYGKFTFLYPPGGGISWMGGAVDGRKLMVRFGETR